MSEFTSGSTITSMALQGPSASNPRTVHRKNNRGQGRGSGNGSGSGSGHDSRTNIQLNRNATRNGFKGNTQGMNRHMFQSHEEQSDPVQYAKLVAPLFPAPPTELTVSKPTMPPGDDPIDIIIFPEEVKQFVIWKNNLLGYLIAIHANAWGQCSKTLLSKIKSLAGYKEKLTENDCVWLLNKIAFVIHL